MKNLFYQVLLTLLMTSFVIVPGGVNAQAVFVPRVISGKSLPGGGLTTRFAKTSADKSLLEQLILPNDSVEFQTCLTKLIDDNGLADVVDAKPAKGKFLVVDRGVPDQISSDCNGHGLIIFKLVTVRIDSSNAAAMMKKYPSLAEKISKLLVPEAKAELVTVVILAGWALSSLIFGGGALKKELKKDSGSPVTVDTTSDVEDNNEGGDAANDSNDDEDGSADDNGSGSGGESGGNSGGGA